MTLLERFWRMKLNEKFRTIERQLASSGLKLLTFAKPYRYRVELLSDGVKKIALKPASIGAVWAKGLIACMTCAHSNSR